MAKTREQCTHHWHKVGGGLRCCHCKVTASGEWHRDDCEDDTHDPACVAKVTLDE